MMEWSISKENKRFGFIEFKDFEYENMDFDGMTIRIFTDITKVPATLDEEIQKQIEIRKVSYVKELNDYYDRNPEIARRSICWSDDPAVINFVGLNVHISPDNPIEAFIAVGFEDAKNGVIESDISIDIDVESHKDMIYEIIKGFLSEHYFR